MKKLIVATSNPGKLQEMQEYLRDLPWLLELKPGDLEIEETGQTFQENAALKATQVAKALGEWAIADDSGLEVTALNGRPGVYSARYGKTDVERISRLLTELGEAEEREARFVCAIAVARSDGSLALQSQGVCQGEILETPQGQGGFGYDPLFYVPETGLTFAQMAPQRKNKLSHRGRAFQALLPQLEKLAP